MENEKPAVRAPLPKTISSIPDFVQVMNAYESTIGQLLSEKYGITPKEFIVTVVNSIKKTPKLLECKSSSLFGAILLSAELGLKPNTPEGLAYIIPYGKDAQFQIGYRGLIEIALRSPQVKQIMGVAVYENEFYEETESGYRHIKYTGMDINKMELIKTRREKLKGLMSEQELLEDIVAYEKRLNEGKGKVVLVYAVAFVEGKDEPIHTSVTADILKKIKELSPSKQSFSGKNDVHDMMLVKAGVKKLFKFLPKTQAGQMARAIELDDAAVMGSFPNITEDGEVQVIDVTEQEKATTKSKISNALSGSKQEEPGKLNLE